MLLIENPQRFIIQKLEQYDKGYVTNKDIKFKPINIK